MRAFFKLKKNFLVFYHYKQIGSSDAVFRKCWRHLLFPESRQNAVCITRSPTVILQTINVVIVSRNNLTRKRPRPSGVSEGLITLRSDLLHNNCGIFSIALSDSELFIDEEGGAASRDMYPTVHQPSARGLDTVVSVFRGLTDWPWRHRLINDTRGVPSARDGVWPQKGNEPENEGTRWWRNDQRKATPA